MDDEDEAASFINQYVSRSVAFVMDVDVDELEQDSTALAGSSKMYEFRYISLFFLDWSSH